jgi:hypothetical protein
MPPGIGQRMQSAIPITTGYIKRPEIHIRLLERAQPEMFRHQADIDTGLI